MSRFAASCASLLARARSFCEWSDGASGPSGGAVYRLWEEGARLGALPTPDRLDPQTKALLEHLRGLGLMDAWRYAATLCPAKAPAFREWRDGGGERQLLALWGEALEVAEREERLG